MGKGGEHVLQRTYVSAQHEPVYPIVWWNCRHMGLSFTTRSTTSTMSSVRKILRLLRSARLLSNTTCVLRDTGRSMRIPGSSNTVLLAK